MSIAQLFADHRLDRVIHHTHLAAFVIQLKPNGEYIDANIVGHINILEGCRHHNVGHLIYSSSSSVYGLNQKQLSTEDKVIIRCHFYAATKKPTN